MKASSLFHIVALASLFTASGCGWYTAESSFERDIPVTGRVDLQVETGSGDITITHGAEDVVRVEARVQVNGSTDAAAQARADEISENPPIEVNGSSIRLGDLDLYDWADELTPGVAISFTIQVPRDTALDLSSGSGNQDVQDVVGPVLVSVGSGDVLVQDVDEAVTAESGSGRIVVRNAGEATATAGSGDIDLSSIADDARANTGSGSITLVDVGGDVTGEAGSGDIVASSALGTQVVWQLETGSGDIELRIGADESFEVNATTGSGQVSSDFAITITGTYNQSELHGTVGTEPDATLDLNTGSGNIEMLKR